MPNFIINLQFFLTYKHFSFAFVRCSGELGVLLSSYLEDTVAGADTKDRRFSFTQDGYGDTKLEVVNLRQNTPGHYSLVKVRTILHN